MLTKFAFYKIEKDSECYLNVLSDHEELAYRCLFAASRFLFELWFYELAIKRHSYA